MKRTFIYVAAIGVVLTFSVNAVLAARDPVISYFTNSRDVRITQPGVQNYLVVDEEIWSHARPDLGDLRVFGEAGQVQYALSVEHGGISNHEQAARILNLGDVGGHTEFDLDMGKIAEYDRIRLNLDAKNFVITISLAGSNAVGERNATKLPTSTLYDFTSEELGSNPVLKLPTSSFRYLHVKLSSGINPQQVKGATVYNLEETKTIWDDIGSCGAPSQKQRDTVITCEVGFRVPVNRIRVQVDAQQVNFRRAVTITDSTGRYESVGEITRVRLNRAGTTVVSEEIDLGIVAMIFDPVPGSASNSGRPSRQIVITIDNGDNPPLAITAVKLLSVERRVYFEPQGKASLKLYYGDSKLDSPIYDYARFFHADVMAAKADLGPGEHNAAYRGRPDERPWSERHNAVLWLAMLLAVAVLAALAIKGLRTRAGTLSS
jgi:hypothetical protein